MSLSLCNACRRHVKSQVDPCPFCGGEVTDAPMGRAPTTRVHRAAMLFGVAAVTVACGGNVEPGPSSSGGASSSSGGSSGSSGGGVALYGAPAPQDAGADAADGGAVAMYGAPGPQDAGNAQGDGGAVALYGAPPLPG